MTPKPSRPQVNKYCLIQPTWSTHAVVTGMTGSGKTGLCIGLLEEAALHGIPAIIIDPKGDLTNLVLHFPSQLPTDFEPWIDPETARREGKTVPEMAVETADRWKKGLGRLGIWALNNSKPWVTARITPSTRPGQLPVSRSISSPRSSLRISIGKPIRKCCVNASRVPLLPLLGLIGIAGLDPLRSREHILLSNLLETAWINKQILTLTELILQVQNPPMDRLGAFPMDSFFPERERFDLAVLLNNFLASPSFQVWQQGQTLDIGAILKSKSGKPRHSIFYIAHLSENERMFFVTLLFAAVESWMRSQRGTGNLAGDWCILMRSWATFPRLPTLHQRL